MSSNKNGLFYVIGVGNSIYSRPRILLLIFSYKAAQHSAVGSDRQLPGIPEL